MKLFIICTYLCLQAFIMQAQFLWDAGIKTGASNYLGDIGGNESTRRNFVADMKLGKTGFSSGAFGRYRILRNVSILMEYNYGRVSGDDKLSSNLGRKYRNLNFRNDIQELSCQAQYCFYSLDDLGHAMAYENTFKCYIGAGVACFYHNPETFYEGNWIDLRPLKTEGEAKPYSKFCMAIPASLGCYVTLKRVYRIGWDICWRTTFTDYIDDISGRYASPDVLKNPLAIALANRTAELNPTPAISANYTPGNKRGDPTHNDSYIFSTFNFSYVIRGKWFRRGLASHGRIKRYGRKKKFRVKF
jgi:hypothetical protein